jgi:hypothetical protein
MDPRARTGSVALGATLVLLLAGCGSTEGKDTGPDQATTTCRGHWKDLGEQVRGNDEKTNPSALAERWNTITAAIDYYASSARASGCEAAISDQKDAISRLTAFETRLAPYDMELRLQGVRDAATTYAASPAPSPSPTPQNKKQQDKNKADKKGKQPPAPPTPAQVGAALKSCTTQAPVATQQQGPGWEQARVIELTDPAAVTKAVKDLAFLSTQSAAYRSCAASLALIKTALAARK